MNYIYTLSDPITNEVRYVGKTINLKQRLAFHCSNCGGPDPRSQWVKSLRVSNMKPLMEVLEEVPKYKPWQDVENFYIEYFRFLGVRLLNGRTLGIKRGTKLTAEHCMSIRLKMRSPELIARMNKNRLRTALATFLRNNQTTVETNEIQIYQ